MYEAFYGLREKPFSILPDPDLIYWCQNHRLAFAMLEFGVMNSAGLPSSLAKSAAGKLRLSAIFYESSTSMLPHA